MKIQFTKREVSAINKALSMLNNIEPIDDYNLRLIHKSGKDTFEIDENIVAGLIDYYTFTLKQTGKPIKQILDAIPSIQNKFEEFINLL